MKKLNAKISSKKANIAVIGLGYVGLPLAISFAHKGFHVVGIDTNAERVERIKNLKSYIADVSNKEIGTVIRKGYFTASTDFALLSRADAIIICVPTPLKRRYTPDVSFMVSAVKSVAKFLKKGTLVILESTTYPGTTEELIKPELEKSGLLAGRDFYLAFSPERIDPGNQHYQVTKIPKVVGGLTPACARLTGALYGQIIKQIHVVSSPKAAEMTKLLENSFRIVNIGWINEVAQMCHKLGIDVWEVIDAAKTKPFGFMPFYPGLGVGGHCIPEDPLYLYWKAKRYGFNSKFIKLAADINTHMPNYAVHRLESLLKKPLEKSKVLVLGVTYKKDVKDLRKSPPLKLIELLKHRHVKTDYYDPLVAYVKLGGLDVQRVSLDAATLKQYDCVVVAVDHTDVDYNLVRKHSKLIFDVKNIYQHIQDRKIVRL
jgi:UDP-N-acetyl-D-glucosamine dehydrogenase